MIAERPLEANSAAGLTTTGASTIVTARGGDAVEIATEVVSEDSGTIVVVLTIGTTIDRRDSMGESADDVSLKNLEVVSTIEAEAEAEAEAAAEAAAEARSVETTGTIDSIIVSTTDRRDSREETAAETDLKTLEVVSTTEAAAARSAETTETIVHRPVARTIVSTVEESIRRTITKVFVHDRTDLSTTDDLWILEDALTTVARASDETETETETAAGPEIDAPTTSKCGARTMTIVETATTIGERDRAVVM
jgi:hypothetical protein